MTHSAAYLAIAFGLILVNCQTTRQGPRLYDLAGTYYRVKSGDTLSHISARSGVSVAEIKETNGITDERSLKIGQALYLPDPDPIGTRIKILKPHAPPPKQQPPIASKKVDRKTAVKRERQFLFPVRGGRIIYRFSRAKKRPYDGIGIQARMGSTVRAAASGKVLFVGDDKTKFGLIVIIEHEDNFITVYTHLHSARVKAQTIVQAGEAIATVGRSGGVTTPHLHFQIRVNQRPQNPENYLKPIR